MYIVEFDINIEEGKYPEGLNKDIWEKIENEEKVNIGMQKSKDDGKTTFKVRVAGKRRLKL